MDDLEIVRLDQGRAGEYHAHIAGSGTGEGEADGSRQVARLTWIAHDGPDAPVRVAEHTLVPRALEGRGIAARLVAELVADARAQGFRIDPQCSYVAAQFRRHPEWADLLA